MSNLSNLLQEINEIADKYLEHNWRGILTNFVRHLNFNGINLEDINIQYHDDAIFGFYLHLSSDKFLLKVNYDNLSFRIGDVILLLRIPQKEDIASPIRTAPEDSLETIDVLLNFLNQYARHLK